MDVRLLSQVKGDGTCPCIYKSVEELLGVILVKKNCNNSCATTSTLLLLLPLWGEALQEISHLELASGAEEAASGKNGMEHENGRAQRSSKTPCFSTRFLLTRGSSF